MHLERIYQNQIISNCSRARPGNRSMRQFHTCRPEARTIRTEALNLQGKARTAVRRPQIGS